MEILWSPIQVQSRLTLKSQFARKLPQRFVVVKWVPIVNNSYCACQNLLRGQILMLLLFQPTNKQNFTERYQEALGCV